MTEDSEEALLNSVFVKMSTLRYVYQLRWISVCRHEPVTVYLGMIDISIADCG